MTSSKSRSNDQTNAVRRRAYINIPIMMVTAITVSLLLLQQRVDSFSPPLSSHVRHYHHTSSTRESATLTALYEQPKFAQQQQQQHSNNSKKPQFQQAQIRNKNTKNTGGGDEGQQQASSSFPSSSKSTKIYRSDGKLAELNEQRVRTAGRVGTKRFVDPCKVFVGNLPYTTTSKQLKEFVLQTMGQTNLIVHSTKIITDWKTGKSKGYGFVMFTDPIFATVCMESVHNKVLDGRHVTVSQGKKKDQDNILYIKKKKNVEELSDEEQAIASGLEDAESDEEDDEVDADLEVDEDGIPIFRDIEASDADDLELDAKLFGLTGDDDDDDDSDIDGIFLERGPIYEDMDPNLNREQRREAARRLKRKKMPHKGFG